MNNPCTVPDADGRFVVYDRKPDIDALSSVVVPASWWTETVSVLEDLFLVDVATCDFCGNDVILGAEKWLGSVSIFSTHSDNKPYNNKKIIFDTSMQQNPANYSIMAPTEDNTALHFLADVALGYYLQPTYTRQTHTGLTHAGPVHSAPAFPPVPAFPAPALPALTLPAPTLPAPTLPAPALASTQGQNSGTGPTGSLAAPNSGPGAMTTTQKSKPRTTGFNKMTGEGAYTSVCGKVTREISKPPIARNKGQKAGYHCPRCNGQFTRARSVKDHFIKCVEKHGNPQGLSWWDHPTLQGAKDWHLKQLQEINEEDDDDD